jgi:hypothetical protein
VRTIAGWLRVAAWLGVLHLVTSPWRGLGGLVDERIRWTAWVAAPVGIALGVTAADAARTRLRLLLYPPGVAGALALLALRAAGEGDASGAIAILLAGYAAGVDVVAGALPLLESPGEGRFAAKPSAGGEPPKPRNHRI